MRAVLLALALALAVAACGAREDEPAVTVLAAASLTDAFEAIGSAFREQTGERVRVSFAASSTLARQIEAGAPADVFASANESWMDYLEERGLIAADTRVAPIGNRLALVAPTDSPLTDVTVNASLDLAALLGAEGRIAVGDPDHVPAGQYAEAALRALGLWEAAEPRLARALDVRGALALVARGEAPLGVVYATDAAIAPGVKIVGVFPAGSHEPIRYQFALLAGPRPPAAERFFAFATGEPGLAIFERYGFARR